MEKFRNLYRITSTRLQKWDYGWNASYFVTICTHNRVCWFGRVESGKMNLSRLGSVAHKLWIEIPEHFPFVILSDFVIMPNHVHGIITIDKQQHNVEAQNIAPLKAQNIAPLKAQNIAPLRTTDTSPITCQRSGLPKNKFGPQSKNLASIVRGYKTGVTKYAHINDPGFRWQSLYYDVIIRDNGSFERIRNYIRNNPMNWRQDEFHRKQNNNVPGP